MNDALERPISGVKLAADMWLEQDWYALKTLDDGTLAIGEPAYHQCNWSYLISNGGQSLLWDTGSGRRNIAPVLAQYAQADLRAFPSHMHFDHLGGVHSCDRVVLADLPMLRALDSDGRITPPGEMYLGDYEGLSAPTFGVSGWIAPGQTLTVGARRFDVLHTPGHSPDSVSLWEQGAARLFAADLIYPGEVYAQVPGACLPTYLRTLDRLLHVLPEDVEIVCAHGQVEHGLSDVPVLGHGDLQALRRAIATVLGTSAHDGELQVNSHMALLYSAASFVG